MTSPLSSLDMKKMLVVDLRKELAARGLDSTGLKGELLARLEKAAASENVPSDAKPVIAASGSAEPVEPSKKVENCESKLPVADGVTPTTSKADSNAVPEACGMLAANGDRKPSESETSVGDVKVVDVPAGEDRDELVKGEKEIAEKSSPLDDQGVSELEKKRKRAERFGVPVCVSEEDKKKARAEKFGLTGNQVNKETVAAKAAPELPKSDSEVADASLKADQDDAKTASRAATSEAGKKASRAELFGIDADADISKKAARAERFGISNDADAVISKKAARAERFGISNGADADTSKKAARTERPSCSPAEQEKMRRRAERFGLPFKLQSELDEKKALREGKFATPLPSSSVKHVDSMPC